MAELTAVAAMGGLTFMLATVLILANRKLFVFEDPKIGLVEEMLPHSNCGACGFAGCHPFAEALVKETVLPGKCTVSSPQQNEDIAKFLGVDVGKQTKVVARLACAGGNNVATKRAHYKGSATCLTAAQVSGGPKACSWGCLGLGDCQKVCSFDAIHMNQHEIPIVDNDKCTACGDCVELCPKDLFSLQAVSHALWVNCRNEEHGDSILENCAVACTACERCVNDAAPGLMSMQNNLAVVNYQNNDEKNDEKSHKKSHDKNDNMVLHNQTPIERCPTGAIVWIDTNNRALKGAAASKIVRQQPLPEANS